MIWNWPLQIADKVWMMDKENGVTIGTPEDLSLNGTLSNFFSRKGIMFDQNTGLFKINNEYSVKMRLEGHGQKYAMVRKALLRNGILAGREIESDVYIETGNLQTEGFLLHLPENEVRKAEDIEVLLKLVSGYLVNSRYS
mgnify:FL=1